jgi:DNA repair exonuclease SbcCD ATPase subunit
MLLDPAFALCLTLAVGPLPTSLDEARQSHSAALSEVETLRAQERTLSSQLATESERVETLKARAEGRILKPGGLDAALRRSQELSSQLSALVQERSGAESRLQGQAQALLDAIGRETETVLEAWQGAGATEKRKLLNQLRGLRAERMRVRRELPPPPPPADIPAAPTDDPLVLRARADALRDAEDKARAQLEHVDRRLKELRSEQDLERQMNESLEPAAPIETESGPSVAGLAAGADGGAAALEPLAQGGGGIPLPSPVDTEPFIGPLLPEPSPDAEDIARLMRDRENLAAQVEALHREALEAEGRAQAIR